VKNNAKMKLVATEENKNKNLKNLLYIFYALNDADVSICRIPRKRGQSRQP
jgi:hypothetical protein